ncbi:hypothetical protein GUJ93_ZPchr0458g22740 [Zizania palustris]|uniref:Uncharacterized protein n=1 Tax=Zizania palustris TaxID=103762 RepID=A0A8J5VE22_ZIZPA|nr:hypothetical protein GUJ93_ZPchr0458g22740 [Zizania palustris]
MAQSFEICRHNTCCSHSHRRFLFRSRYCQFCRRQPRLLSRRCHSLYCHPAALLRRDDFGLLPTSCTRGDR